MKLYRIVNNSVETKYSLSLDPGIKTSGFCFLNKETGKVNTKTFLREVYTRVSFPVLYILSKEMTDLYIEELKKQNWDQDFKNLELNLEYTFTPGSFAASLNTQISYIISRFIELGIGQITLLPTKVPGFFIQSGNEAIDEKLLKKWFEVYIPEIKTDSTHSRDALMLSLFCHFDIYLKKYKNVFEIRVPEIELINLEF